nr:hypothetical protein [Tanacetum cinerariifolium]
LAPSTDVKSPGKSPISLEDSLISQPKVRKRKKHTKQTHSAENENTEPVESKRLKSRKKKLDINEEPSAGFRKKRDDEEAIEDLSAVLKTRAENNGSVKVNPSGLEGLKNEKLTNLQGKR